MHRHKLDSDDSETEFLLFGISSQSKNYRIVWLLNRNLGLSLKRMDDIVDYGARFPFFSYENTVLRLKYIFIHLKDNGCFLIKDIRQMDYLLYIGGNCASVNSNSVLTQIKNCETILGAYQLNPVLLTSKPHLLHL